MSKRQLPQKNIHISPKRLLGAIIAIGIFCVLFVSVFGLAKKYLAIRKNMHDLKLQQVALQQKQDALIAQNAYLETPNGQEQSLRSKFNMVRPGEGMIVITNKNPSGAAVPGQESFSAHWWQTLLKGLGIRKG